MTTDQPANLRLDPASHDGRGDSLDARLTELEKQARLVLAGIEEIRKLRRAGDEACDAVAADPLVEIAFAAKAHGVSKEAARKKARRMGLAVREGGRLKIHLSAVPALYQSNLSHLSKDPAMLPVRRGRRVSLPSDRRR